MNTVTNSGKEGTLKVNPTTRGRLSAVTSTDSAVSSVEVVGLFMWPLVLAPFGGGISGDLSRGTKASAFRGSAAFVGEHPTILSFDDGEEFQHRQFHGYPSLRRRHLWYRQNQRVRFGIWFVQSSNLPMKNV